MKQVGVAALALALIGSVHVGTDDVSFAGDAGPYPVRVTIRQPGVVPGLADITVRTSDAGVERVLVTALRRIGAAGEAPPPDEASPVPGETGIYSAQLWLMVRGPHSVIVTVHGDRGEGRVTIPIVARATARLEMSRALGFVLAGGGIFLVIGLLSIVGAATRESALLPNAMPAPRDFRRARIAVGATGILLAVLLFGGWSWIRAEADSYRARLDRPWRVNALLDARSRTLGLAITDLRWRNRPRNRPNDIIPDHGKMMHLFVVNADDASAFAHIHPVRTAQDSFSVPFPPLPAGRYRIFADIVQEDGAAHTLVTEIEAPATELSAREDIDPDDAWWIGSAADGDIATVGDGIGVRWLNRSIPLVAGEDGELEFGVETSDGSAVAIEPYMGMAGHAMLARTDGQVFVHLHPVGMISMAAQAALDPASTHASHAADADTSVIRFPFVTPPAGDYRIWLQVRLAGEIRTVAFDATINAAPSEADR